jgi:hypothetical protein
MQAQPESCERRGPEREDTDTYGKRKKTAHDCKNKCPGGEDVMIASQLCGPEPGVGAPVASRPDQQAENSKQNAGSAMCDSENRNAGQQKDPSHLGNFKFAYVPLKYNRMRKD